MLNPRNLASLVGAVLIILGSTLVTYQLIWMPAPPRMRGLDFSPTHITLRTTYPALIMIGIGAVLMLASLIRVKPN
jgi:hypothetical protein